MEAKKSASANLENQKGFFTLLGFVVVLGFVYIFFEWADKEVEVYTDDMSQIVFEEEEMVVQTQQQVTPPPPAPEVPVEVPPEIKVTDKEVATSTDAFNSESKVTDVIAPPPPPPAPVAKPVEKDEDVVFVAVEKAPEFPGGQEALYKFLNKNLNYPAAAKESGIQGRIICQFTVNRDGSIVDVVVLRGVDPDLDKEAVAVIKKMPNWIPGEQSRKKVRCKFTLPVVFKLN